MTPRRWLLIAATVLWLVAAWWALAPFTYEIRGFGIDCDSPVVAGFKHEARNEQGCRSRARNRLGRAAVLATVTLAGYLVISLVIPEPSPMEADGEDD